VWKGDAENEIREVGIVNCRKIEQERDGWSRATRDLIFTCPCIVI
jgi:hypothetical protein